MGVKNLMKNMVESNTERKIKTMEERIIEAFKLALEDTTPEKPGVPWNNRKHKTYPTTTEDEWI